MIDIWHYPLKDDRKLRARVLKVYRDIPHHFNVTHTDGLCWVAVSTSGPVGIDAELKTRKLNARGVVKRYGHRNELKLIEKLSHKKLLTFALRSWVLKEAIGKCCKVGVQQKLFKSIDATKVCSPMKNKTITVGRKKFAIRWIKMKKHYLVTALRIL